MNKMSVFIKTAAWRRNLDALMLGVQMLLVAGIPLVFSNLTHSVFEINKLTWLRILTLVLLGLWAARQFLFDGPTHKNNGRHYFSPRLTEWLILAWGFSNLLSTLFSPLPQVALTGVYDRWEGLWTVLNYAVLLVIFSRTVTGRRQFYWILGAMVGAVFLSAGYGLAQSLGYDFMRWNTKFSILRVTSTVNNPVHFCAYAGMLFPVVSGCLLAMARQGTRWRHVAIEIAVVALALIFYVLLLNQNDDALLLYLLLTGVAVFVAGYFLGWQGSLFCVSGFCIYAMTISYSRAAWQGLSVALIFFFMAACRNMSPHDRPKVLWADMALTLVAIGAMFALIIFRLDLAGKIGLWGLGAALLAYAVFLFWIFRSASETALRLALIAAFVLLQRVVLGFEFLALYAGLGAGIAFLIWKRFKDRPALRSWILLLYAMVALLACIPQFPHMWDKLFHGHDPVALQGMDESRAADLHTELDHDSPRKSLLKSGLAWWLDGWQQRILGTGPDTILDLFSKYRRPEFGFREGHHISMDRLHNAYLDTLATRGALGFLAYFGGVVGLGMALCWVALSRQRDQASGLILAGLWAGGMVFWVQLLFNFGVVVTVVYAHIFLALGLTAYYRPNLFDTDVGKLQGSSGNNQWATVSVLRLSGWGLGSVLFMCALWFSFVPYRADWHFMRGLWEVSRAGERAGIRSFVQATRLMPGERQYELRLAQSYEALYKQTAEAQEKRKWLSEARDAYARIIKGRPFAADMLALADLYVQDPYAIDLQAKEQNGQYAKDLYVKAVAVDPNSLNVLKKAAEFMEVHGQDKLALQYYSQAETLDDGNHPFWLALLRLHERHGDQAAAEKVRAQAQARVQTYRQQAQDYLAQGDVHKARDALDWGASYDPSNIDIRLKQVEVSLQQIRRGRDFGDDVPNGISHKIQLRLSEILALQPGHPRVPALWKEFQALQPKQATHLLTQPVGGLW